MLKIPANKIVAYISSKFEAKPRKNGEEYVINNPFVYDTGFHFNVNPEKGVCHDWRGDEWAGPINPKTGKRNCSFIKFVSLYEKVEYGEAIKIILGSDYITFRTEAQKLPVIKEQMELPKSAVPLTTSTYGEKPMLMRWLISRGYDENQVAEHSIHHRGVEVIWPYYEYEELVYWQSRSRLNKRFAFPSSEMFDDDGNVVGKREFGKGDFLYGFDQVDHGTYVIITEGIFDKNTLGPQALASGGALLTSNQINKLKLLNPKKGVILAPDNDTAGVQSALTNHAKLRQSGLSAYIALPPDYVKDWNELITERHISKAQIRLMFDERIQLLNPITITKLRSKYRMTSTL
jgi:hypothetical protein